MIQYSPEPWSLMAAGIVDAFGKLVIDREVRIARWVKVVFDDGDLDRIVACVNACRGIPTDELLKITAWKSAAKDNACAEAATMLSEFGWTVTSPDGGAWEPDKRRIAGICPSCGLEATEGYDPKCPQCGSPMMPSAQRPTEPAEKV